MDGFDKKREMIHTLMGMLKKNASDEVGAGLPKPPEPANKPSLPMEHTSPMGEEKMAEGGRAPMNLDLKKGALHEQMGVPQSEPIPSGKLEKATNSDDELLRKRAQFAENAKKWHHAHGGMVGVESTCPECLSHKDDIEKMADGGMASPSDEPEREMNVVGENEAPTPVAPERAEDAEANYDTSIEENDDEDNQNSFNAFLGKKRKK